MNLNDLALLVDEAEIQGPDRLTEGQAWALVSLARVLWVNLTVAEEHGQSGLMTSLVQDLANVVVED